VYKYKLIACDLDGTLLGSDLKLSELNKKAISTLTKKGIYFVPTTGRTLSEMKEVVDFHDVRYIIYSNGVAFMDKNTGEKKVIALKKETLKTLLEKLETFDCYIVFHCDGKSYVNSKSQESFDCYNVSYNVQELVKDCAEVKEDIISWACSEEKIECACVFFKNEQDMRECKNHIAKLDDLLVVDSFACNIEIFSKNAGKGNMLKRLAEYLDIDLKNIMTVGDSDNDSSMTQISGLGLATSNACENLKNVADEIICSNDEHVADYILNKYFQNK